MASPFRGKGALLVYFTILSFARARSRSIKQERVLALFSLHHDLELSARARSRSIKQERVLALFSLHHDLTSVLDDDALVALANLLTGEVVSRSIIVNCQLSIFN